MKKKLWIVLTTAFVIGVVGACGNSSDGEKKGEISKPAENQFDATVLEISDDYIMVEALDGQDIVGEVRVHTGLLSEDASPELEKGDVVRVTHDGKMTMSLPPQMTAVELMEITE